MVKAAADNLRQGDPFVSKARFRAELFGVKINGPGQIMVKGQGSGLSRMEFVFTANQIEQRLIQVCDDEFFYFIRHAGDQRLVESIDLQKLAEARNQSAGSLLSGSLSSMLERLHDLFAFEAPQTDKLGDLDVYRIRGSWRKKAIENLLSDEIDSLGDPDNHRVLLPRQVPDEIELVLARSGKLPYLPYQINS